MTIPAARRRRARRVGSEPVLALALVAALAILVGCGIPTDDRPRPLAVDSSSTTAPGAGGCTQSPEPPEASSAALYFSEGTDQPLVAVRRPLAQDRTAEAVLRLLLDGPTADERACNVVSLIPLDTTVLSASESEGTLRVNLSEQWGAVRGPNQPQAYAQIVLSVTEVPGVDQVRFFVAGDPVPAPTPASGNEDVVTRGDYRALDPD